MLAAIGVRGSSYEDAQAADVAGKAMFPKLMDVMWKRKRDGKLYVKDFGFVMRPLEVKSEKYKKEYEDLRTRLQGYLDAKDAEAGAKNGR